MRTSQKHVVYAFGCIVGVDGVFASSDIRDILALLLVPSCDNGVDVPIGPRDKTIRLLSQPAAPEGDWSAWESDALDSVDEGM